MSQGTDLQRHDLDPTAFPDALCNDGTPAVIYYRPFEGLANRNRWAIQLVGGGSCNDKQGCANRWCSVGTNFSMTQMTSKVAPAVGTVGEGIFERRTDNPIGNWNQVLVRYCSSDGHAGVSRDVVLDVADPVTGAPRTVRMHFLGARIVDAVIETLRQQGAPGLVYTLGGANTALPDLDQAEQVVFAGASAGGGGVASNVDRLATRLRAANPGVAIRALIDSAFSPDRSKLDYSTTNQCTTFGVCSYAAQMAKIEELSPYDEQAEDSCASWHAQHAPTTAYACTDRDHLVRHHITTPMFVRMSQTDMLLSQNYVGVFSVPGGGLMTLADFASMTRTDMAALANLKQTAEEGAAITIAPGGFSPVCSKHETLRSTPHTFNTTIGAAGVTMFQVITAWVTGGSTTFAITPPGGTEVCPP